MKKAIYTLCLVLIVTVSAKSQIKVACIGNSITYGYGLSSPSTQSYPTRLQSFLGDNYEVTNFGVNSRTMLKNGDKPYWNESQYTQALALNPDIVIIMLGTNDAKLELNWTPYKEEFDDDYKDMIEAFRSLSSQPTIYICCIVPAYAEIWDISNTTIDGEVNPKIVEVAWDKGVNLIDMYTQMENKSSLFQSDGIHPNASGAVTMASYFHSILSSDAIDISYENQKLKAPSGTSYQWYFNDEVISEEDGGNQQTLQPSEEGSYKVLVQSKTSSNTALLSNTYEYSTTSTKEVILMEEIHAYPNPCKTTINLSLEESITVPYEVNIFNTNGVLVYNTYYGPQNQSVKVDVTNIPTGSYFFRIQNGQNLVGTGKFTIDR